MRMQLRNHVDTQPVERFKRYKSYVIYCMHDIKIGTLQVHEDKISLHKWSGGTAHQWCV